MRAAGLLSITTLIIMALGAGGCSDVLSDEAEGGEPVVGLDYLSHDTPEDLVESVVGFKSPVPGIPESFDRNRVVDDSFFNAGSAVTADQVQAFFERNPYGTRTFLADTTVNGMRAADAIVQASRAHNINPILMLARMQVEKSLIAKTSRPSSSSVDYAFGCGCPDGRSCNSAYRGLDRQIDCAANTLRSRYEESTRGAGIWNRGVARNSLDPLRVVPSSHATAALYAYTPWVLVGRGGNWLVWNITLRYARHFASIGEVNVDDSGSSDGGDVGASLWIGDLCATQADDPCSYSSGGVEGHCQPVTANQGICALACEGLCPDRAGHTSTFCVDGALFGAMGGGVCTVYADSANQDCAALGMVARSTSRYVGGSGARARTAEVCVPATPVGGFTPSPEPEPEPEPEPTPDPQLDPCAPGAPAGGYCDGEVATRCVNGIAERLDCTELSQTCEVGGYGVACRPGRIAASASDPRCNGSLSFEGTCDGNVALWCARGDVYGMDCAWYGRTCAYGGDGNGYWCR